MATSQTDHPYLLAKQEWEEMNGTLKTRLVNWQRVAALFGLIALVLAIGLVLDRRQEKTVRYVAVVDRHGQVYGYATVSQATGTIDGVKVDELQRWVWEARTVLTEADAQRALIKDVMRKTTDDTPAKATSYMQGWYPANDPYKRAKTGTVTIEIISTLARSNDTYELEWVETTHSTDGSVTPPEQWKGVFRVLLANPSPEEAPFNPAGFYVTEVNWSKKV